MNKKVVVLGGGTGMSTLLKGLKNFPVDITAIVAVSDDGSSSGRLRKEFDMPAVGDIRKVLISLSETEPLVEKLLDYRFVTSSDLNGHPIGNLLLVGLSNICGNMSDGIESIGKVLNLKGKIVPLTEDNAILVSKMKNGSIIEGEEEITAYNDAIDEIYYKTKPVVTPKALNAIKNADLIILSMGSLYTSIIPNLLCKEVVKEIDNSKAKIMYISNIMTQPGETDNFKVSDHINLLNKYLGNKKVNVVIANNKKISKKYAQIYKEKENKDQVEIDYENIKSISLIATNLMCVENNYIRHDSLKLALKVFTYLLQ